MKNILQRVKKDRVRFIDLQFSDIDGLIKSVTITTKQLRTALKKGMWFDGSSIEGFTRIAESDMYLKPDINTYAVIPWQSENGATARFICDVYTPDNKPFIGDPRYVLKKVLAEARKMGFIYKTGPELEFFLFDIHNNHIEPLAHDKGSYFDLSMDKAYNIRKEMVNSLEKMGIEVEMSHHEVAPGQHEINFKYDNALRTADNASTLKFTLKAIAEKYGLHATFMPKPLPNVNGSGMHVHQSLFHIKTGKNAFSDPSDRYKLSKIAKHFIAGQIQHIKAMSAILTPTVNSYKRLVPGHEAPTYICWGQTNRSALIRIPMIHKGNESSTRAEIRCPDPSCNPYLAFAVMLKAGLDGIKKKLILPRPVEENVYELTDKNHEENNIDSLPHSLWQAIKALKNDPVIQNAIGPHTFSIFIAAKTEEWDDYSVQVTRWEIDKYLEKI